MRFTIVNFAAGVQSCYFVYFAGLFWFLFVVCV